MSTAIIDNFSIRPMTMKTWMKNNRATLLWILIGALATAFLSFSYATSSLGHFAVAYFWSWLIWMTQWFGNGYITDKISEQVTWMDRPLLRAILGIIGLVVYSSLAFTAVQIVMGYLVFGVDWRYEIGWHTLKYPILISGTIALVLHAAGFFANWRKSEIEAEKLRTQMMTYQYESLRNQINPHFLFNSFNVLSELVYEDQSLAVKFIRQLSDIYRYVLDSKDKELVPLAEEMEFIQKFGFLLQTRFEDHLKIDLDVNTKANEYIVPMSLQLLLENAVKHNEISEAFPLQVSIYRSDDYVVVKNSLKRKEVGEWSSKQGLENIQKRYEYLSDQKMSIEENLEHYMVRIPILTKEEA